MPIPAPLDTSGWYIRADVGVGVDDSYSFRSSLAPTNALGGAAPPFSRVFSSMGDAAIIGLGVGYQFNHWFRADITGEYRFAANYKAGNTYTAFCGATFCLDTYSGQFSQAVFLTNGYVDVGTWYGVTPFVGAGVGFARSKLASLTDNGAGNGFASDTVKTNFAWAAHAGLGYNVSPNLKLEFSYRYLNTGAFRSNAIVCEDTPSCFYEQQSFRTASHDFRGRHALDAGRWRDLRAAGARLLRTAPATGPADSQVLISSFQLISTARACPAPFSFAGLQQLPHPQRPHPEELADLDSPGKRLDE